MLFQLLLHLALEIQNPKLLFHIDEIVVDVLPEASLVEIKNQNNIIKLLLEKGANVDVKNHSLFTPLHKAALGGAEEALKLLLSHNPNINALANSESTALDLVLMRSEMLGEQNSEIADLLRKHGAKTAEELKSKEK